MNSDMISFSAIVSLIGVVGTIFSIMKEKAAKEREIGKLEAELKALRDRVDRLDLRGNRIDDKLEQIIEAISELRARLN
jgi:predicted nuclease with TOPRIM domain